MRRTILLALLILTGCVTPVIPLPPPRIEDLSFALTPAKDAVTITGSRNLNLSGSWIFVVNSRAGKGTMKSAEPDGSFTTDPLDAKDRDAIHLWAAPTYIEATGDVTCVVLDFTSGKPQRCSQ